LVLPPSNQAALTSLLAAQQDPTSPSFHRWLAPGQFHSEFGPAQSDVSAVTSWLRADGFSPSVSGYQVSVTASESSFAGAFGVSFERYALPGGGTGYVASSAPLVPSDLASGKISSILGLNTTYKFKSHATFGNPNSVSQSPLLTRPNADGLTPCSAASTEAGGNYYTLDQEGADYGVGSLLSAGETGTGQTIGLYELGQSSATDISTYESCFGLTNAFSAQLVDGGASSGSIGTEEADLDAEEAMTQAPGARVISYEGPNTTSGAYDVWNAIVTADAAQVISTSWGLCEPNAVAGGMQGAYTTLFKQASSQGQSIFAASGDSGSEDCFQSDLSTSEQVDYPASDSWVTAVGGTDLFSNGSQTTWNDCQNNESLACAESLGGVGAGGGGMSRYEPRQGYQPNILSWPVPQSCGTLCREVPDISANAGVGMVVYANGGWTLGGGTSFASPFMSGLVADSVSGCGRIGVFTPLLYSLYAHGSYGSAFDDITSGNTDLTGSNGGAYPATSGYDAATGIGSPIAPGLTCPAVTSVSSGYTGSNVTVSGLGLEHATIYFGAAVATVMSANATSATVVVPAGGGTVNVTATSVAGNASRTAPFTYGTPPPPPPPPPPPSPQHGYWLVGSDGGIFSFGSAQFYGSTGNLRLQRPVVGIVPTKDPGGYWLDASDGGVFSFGDTQFYGSMPGLGLHPAGSGLPHSLNAPIVGMVPSHDQGGYFMVASDGGVFAFGDAHFAGSCPGIGGCAGAAVAVMPDASGGGYWLITSTGHVYTFGDAPYLGAPGPQSSPITSAVATPSGHGYDILDAAGQVFAYGDANALGNVPPGATGGLNPATAIFVTSDNGGYWVSDALGKVFTFGDAPGDGDMSGTHLNGPIVAASGS
jgi:kumamolisin